MRVQISLKKTLHVIDHQGKNITTNIAEVQTKDVVFPTIDNIEFVDWTSINKGKIGKIHTSVKSG